MKRLIFSLLAFLPVMAFPQQACEAEWQGDSIVTSTCMETAMTDSVVTITDSLVTTTTETLPEMDIALHDSVSVMMQEQLRNSVLSDSLEALNRKIAKYEQRMARRHRVWAALMPSTMRIQYAGSTGLINLGMGWEYGKHHQWETDFMFGYVPKYDKDESLMTFTLRQTYVPWTKGLYGKRTHTKGQYWYTWQPLSCGMFVNTVLSSDYWTKEPERYPDRDYYRFSSKIRFHLFLGQRYSVHVPRERRYLFKEISFVWEISTCDLYVVSKFVNASLPFKEILSLSLGLKFKI